MHTEAWQMRSCSGYYLPLTSFATVTTWLPLEIATMDDAPGPFAVTAACGCIISDDLGNLPPCVECGACEEHCTCVCECCGLLLHGLDYCPTCLEAADMGDDVDHTEGVLGDLDEQVREVS